MKISANIADGTLVVRKEEEGQQAAVWSRKLDDFVLRKNVDTGIPVTRKQEYKIVLWRQMGENVLMVYTRNSRIRAVLAPGGGAYLRVLERICEVQHVSLGAKGLAMRLCIGVVNRNDLDISDARLQIGERASHSFDLPVLTSGKKLNEDNPALTREFTFSLDELTREMEETSSRIEVMVNINGVDVAFPIKIHIEEEDVRYQHVPMYSFYHKNDAVQLKHTGVGNLLFVCRPQEPVEKTRAFRFWESERVSGYLYRKGRKEKERSPQKVALFYEKFCQKAEEGTFEIFEMAWKRNPKGAYFIINEKSPDYPRIKDHPNVVKQYSPKYYRLLFRANCYISTETPFHLNIVRSNNKYFRRSIAENTFVFLQHGVTYLKCHGPNSPFLAGREMEPDYIVVNSDKEKAAVQRMLDIPADRILKTGMAIFSKLSYGHITQESDDIAVIMLTWKPYEDNMEDFTRSSYYKNTLAIYHLLNRYLPAEQIRIVIHPKTGALLENTELSPAIWRGPISEVLKISKLLITDYSSVCYNSFYQGGGVVFFQEDIEYYEKENGKLIPADDEYIGRRAFSLEELENVLAGGLKDGRILLDHFRTEEFVRRYREINEFSDGKNMERLCDTLKELHFI